MMERSQRITRAMEQELNKDWFSSEPAAEKQDVLVEKRREARFQVPDACRKYVALEVKHNGEYVPGVLANFSRQGILFESPVAFAKGSRTECKVTISLVLSREVAFNIEVMYCYQNKGSYIAGASIDTISDPAWFDAFVEVYDIIVLKHGSD